MTLNKPWKSVMHMFGITTNVSRTSFKAYTMPEARVAMKKQRAIDSKAGRPLRKVSPVSTWILDDAIDDFVEKFSKEYELEVLEILDLRHA